MKKCILIILCGIILFNVTGCFDNNAAIEKNEYRDISTLNQTIDTKYLFKYNDTLYSMSKDNLSIDLIDPMSCDEFIGSINTIINENYIPMYNGEANNKELKDAKICGCNKLGAMVELKNGSLLFFDSVDYGKETFMFGVTLNDGRVFHFAKNVPYITKNTKTTLFEAVSNENISLNKIINNLELRATYKDGGSKLYEYNPKKKIFGNESFYLLVCNSVDKINDIYLAQNKKTLENKCNFKVDDIKEVKMSIKNKTLTNKGATVIITDTSNTKYIYGESYYIQKYDNNIWNDLSPIKDLIFTSIGYYIESSKEFKIDWEFFYGELKPGRYRILKDFSEQGEATNHYVSAEFIIEDQLIKKIENNINKIISNGDLTSSNPNDYIIKNKKVYDELLSTPKETYEYAIRDLINNQTGLKGYIEAKLCSDINKNFKYDFKNASDYIEEYKKYLFECDCTHNEYDIYAISLLKIRD